MFVDGTRGISLFLRGRFKEARDLLEAVSERQTMQKRSGWQSNALSLRRRHAHGAGRPARGQLPSRATAARRRRARRPLHHREPAYARDGLPVCSPRTTRTSRGAISARPWRSGRRRAFWSSTGRRCTTRRRSSSTSATRCALTIASCATRPRSRGASSATCRCFASSHGTCGAAAPSRPPTPFPSCAPPAWRRRAVWRGGSRRRTWRWASLAGSILTASVANATGDRPGAIAALREVLAGATEAELMLHVAAARYQLGSLLGGDAGKDMVAAGRRRDGFARRPFVREDVRPPRARTVGRDLS